MCKSTPNLTQKQRHEVYFDQSRQSLLLDNAQGLWFIPNVTHKALEGHIFTYGKEGIDYKWGVVCEFCKHEGRLFSQDRKLLIVDIDEWLDHYIETHHSELIEIPE